MKANEAQRDSARNENVKLLVAGQHGRGQYQKVFDARKRRVCGLWGRTGTFYGQLTITDPNTGNKAVRRVRLEDKDGQPVTTVPQAVALLNKMKGQRDDDLLKITPKRTPTLNEYAETYTARFDQLSSVAGNAKRPVTIRLEKALLRTMSATLGERHKLLVSGKGRPVLECGIRLRRVAACEIFAPHRPRLMPAHPPQHALAHPALGNGNFSVHGVATPWQQPLRNGIESAANRLESEDCGT